MEKFPCPPLPNLGKVMDLQKWHKNNPLAKRAWITVEEWGKIVNEVIVYSSGEEIGIVEFPEGYGAVCLPWVPGSDDGYLLAGRHEDLEKILAAYNEVHHARRNFFEVLKSLEE